MHLSSQEEYGLRCLLRLATHDAESPVRIQDIAEAEGLSQEYVAKLMRILRNGELVTSTRGASGGYHLARAAADITVWEAIVVLGGSFFTDSFCQSHPGSLRDCVHSTDCSIRALWRNVGGLLRAALSSVTLENLKNGEQKTLTWLSATDAISVLREARQ
jgi:Rrf2 family protein